MKQLSTRLFHVIDIETYWAVGASTNKKTSIFTVTNQIPHFSFCNTMESSNGTIMTPKYANIGLKLFLATTWQILFARSPILICS